MTRVWVDISNAPHTLLFRRLIKNQQAKGHEVLVTAREYNGTRKVLESLGINAVMVGEYGGASLVGKLKASIEREAGLVSLVHEFAPDYGAFKHSVEGARIAFGLGIPFLMMIDNEQAEHIIRLTVPLSTIVLVPRALGRLSVGEWGPKKVMYFNGFFELEHVRGFKPDKSVLKKAKVKPNEFVIVRPEASTASYVNGAKSRIQETIDLLRRYFDVLVYPRGKGYWVKYHKSTRKDATVSIVEDLYDSLSLTYYAGAVISAGGTMNREAIALGTPALSMYPKHPINIDWWLIQRGVMLRELDPRKAVEAILHAVNSRDEWRETLREFVRELETPPIEEALENLEELE